MPCNPDASQEAIPSFQSVQFRVIDLAKNSQSRTHSSSPAATRTRRIALLGWIERKVKLASIACAVVHDSRSYHPHTAYANLIITASHHTTHHTTLHNLFTPPTSIRLTSITPGPDSFSASLISVAASASPSASMIAAYRSSTSLSPTIFSCSARATTNFAFSARCNATCFCSMALLKSVQNARCVMDTSSSLMWYFSARSSSSSEMR